MKLSESVTFVLLVEPPEEGQVEMGALHREVCYGWRGKTQTLHQVQPPFSSESQHFVHLICFPVCQSWPLKVEFAYLEHEPNSLTLLKAMWSALLQEFMAKCSQVSVVFKVLLARSKSRGWKPQSQRVGSIRPVRHFWASYPLPFPLSSFKSDGLF